MTSLPVIIIGANSFGIEIANICELNKVVVYGFLDKDPKKKDLMVGEIPVLGTTEEEEYWNLIGKTCNVFVALENVKERESMIEHILEDRKTQPTNITHPSAQIAQAKCLSYGNFIGANAVIETESKLSEHVIIGSGAIIQSGAQIDQYAQIKARAVIGKEAKIGYQAYIGDGAIILSGIEIGKNASIGVGSVVIKNVENKKQVFGNPAV